MSEPLAHSAHDGRPAQTYREHVGQVIRKAMQFGSEASAFSAKWREDFLAILEMAASYHDLGKLDEVFQEDLWRNHRKTRLNHVDAGVAHLLRGGSLEAAVVAYGHHLGLPSFPAENAKRANGLDLRLRDDDSETAGSLLWQRTDHCLDGYLEVHHKILPPVFLPAKTFGRKDGGLRRRLLLSCLVDADHSDTARHYGNEPQADPPSLRAAERLDALDRYVATLAATIQPTSEREKLRYELRQEVYRACRERPILTGENIVACSSPVGSGKTTSVMAHLLRVAAERRLRRIFVILPFTNIIDQSVGVYRSALRLQDETQSDMDAVVAAHHHRVDYASYELRHLAARWDSPIIVTTAVQFFETLAANKTSALRKLHRVAGSAIFVDEAHAAMPAALWPQMFHWLRELCDDWGCHAVLASGSLTRFWTLDEFVSTRERCDIPEIVTPETVSRTKDFERARVSICTRPDRLSLPHLAKFVLSKPGPRVIVLNTVQSAAVLAKYLCEDLKLGLEVEHISTALTPLDRANTVQRVRERLNSENKNWCLVATSCIEAGVDFSFHSAFRERWGLVNLLQIAGRASRSGEYLDTEIWDFRHDGSLGLCPHPQAKIPAEVLEGVFQQCAAEQRQPSPDDSTEALRLEVRNDHGTQVLRIEEIECAECAADYPKVSELCRIIDAPTRTVIVDGNLIKRIESRDPKQFPSWREVMQNSVQIWATRLDAGKLPVKPIGSDGELWAWIGKYDSFLGYMAGALELLGTGYKGFEPL